jgi:hypothetical protein
VRLAANAATPTIHSFPNAIAPPLSNPTSDRAQHHAFRHNLIIA